MLTDIRNIGPGKQLQRIINNVARIDTYLEQVGEEVLLQILAEHFQHSGIKSRTGDLLAAITERGAKGNVFQKSPGGLRVGVDYGTMPRAKYVIEGRRAVVPVNKKVLRWIDPETGKPVFSKYSRPVPPHPIYYLTSSDLIRLENALIAKLTLTQSRDSGGRFSR